MSWNRKTSDAPAPARRGKSEEETLPERIYKLKECCDLLLAGGYFRARIPTLSPFDKVVGGMVWSITASNVGVDVDLLFEENSTIGQRIKLSENIVMALNKMQCPTRLQSHQIQGLDYDNLFPVIQWLVKQVIQTRLLTGDEVRALSVSQFSKSHELPEDYKPAQAMEYIVDAAAKYQAQRKFRKREGATFDSEVARIEATLLEYGEKIYGPARVDEEQEENRRARGKVVKDADAAAEEAKRAEAELEEKKRIEMLQGQLSGVADADGKVSGSAVGQIVSLSADAIRRQASEYDDEMKRAALDGSGAGSGNPVKDAKRAAEVAHKRQVEALRRKIAAATEQLENKRVPVEELEKKVADLKAAVAAQDKHAARCESEIAKLEAIENEGGNKEIIAKLRALVVLNESLKKQESQFKQSCKAELQRLNDMIAKLDTGESDEELRKMLEIEKIYGADLAKLTKLRQALAKKNQEIAKITRAIDDIPTRAELLQFERRFVELYELVAEKLLETRKYYAMYNTLRKKISYMQTEVTILESIIQNFPIGMKSKTGQETMLKQFGKMMEGVTQSKTAVVEELAAEKTAEDDLVVKHNKLLEKQRAYFKAVKEFQEECTKNERLTAALAALDQ